MSPRRRIYLVALLTGALLTLAFPEPSLWFIAWFALAPLLFLTSGAGPRRGAIAWAVFGFGFFGTLLSWISIAGWIAWAVLLVVEIPFVAAFGALWGWLSGRTGRLGRVALAAGAWAMLEFLRSIVPLGGFTWGQLAQSQHDVPWLLAWAGLGGSVFLGGIMAGFNASVAVLAARETSVAKRAARLAAAIVVIVGVGVLWWSRDPGGGTPLRIALVQGDVDPTVPQDFEKDFRILTRHVELTEAIDEPVDLVVWPESAAAIDPDHQIVAPLIERAATAVDAPMVIGGTEDVDKGHDEYKVMTFLISPTGELVDRYQKTHLVPFGEYVPARDLLDWLPILEQVPRDAVPGAEETIFTAAGIEIAPVLSFEGDFGSLVRRRIAAGGRLLIVATNTSTWRNSWASAQHVAFSQVRAVENGVPVVHAAISGISAFIDEGGAVQSSLPLYEPGVALATVEIDEQITPYARYGEWILLALIAGCAFVWAIGRRGVPKVASPDA